DAMSAHSSDGQDDIFHQQQQQQLIKSQADDSDSGLDAPNSVLQTPTSNSRAGRVGSQSGGESSNGEDADARDIRRYEQRLRNRRANMVSTPRSRRSSFTKPSSLAAGSSGRRNKSSALLIDVDAAAGESLGDILGTGTLWGDQVSVQGTGSLRGAPPPSLAAELGSLEASATLFTATLPKRSLSSASPTWRPRTRSSRGLPSPFGDSSGGFGISYGESVSLAEQLAAVGTPAMPRVSAAVERPHMVDVGTSTDSPPVLTDAETTTAALEAFSTHASVQASLALPSANVAVGTASTEPGATRAWGMQSMSSAFSLVDAGSQTQDVASRDCGTHTRASTADQQ
ncbi:hypothetical protein GGI20_006334, partial [Coemansia sp. BCRC 34301]